LQIRDEFVGDEFGEQLDTGAVNVMGKRSVQRLDDAFAGGRVARADRCRVRAVRTVRDDCGRGSVLRGHRPAPLSRDGERGQLRCGRGGYLVSVRRGRRSVGPVRAVRRAGSVPVRVPRGVRRSPLRPTVRYRVRSVREDMHRSASEQRTGSTQRICARPLAAAATTTSAAAAAAATAATTTVSTTATTAAVQQ